MCRGAGAAPDAHVSRATDRPAPSRLSGSGPHAAMESGEGTAVGKAPALGFVRKEHKNGRPSPADLLCAKTAPLK